MNTPIELFISYVSEDRDIANALNNALTDAFGNELKVFLDVVSIQQGADLKAVIEERLRNADSLIIISTGHDRASYDWAGFELGFFVASHATPRAGRALWGHIVSLCSEDAPPKPEERRVHIRLDSDEQSMLSHEEYKENLRIAPSDPFLRWFGDLFHAINGVDLRAKKQEEQRITGIVTDLRITIFSHFKTRPRLVERPQSRIVASWIHDHSAYQRGRLPEDARIRLMGGASRVFGMPTEFDGKEMKWGEFVARLKASPTSKLQLHTLRTCLLSAAISGAVNRTSDGLLPTADYRELFRLVLNTCTTYYNNRVEANVGLIEVYRRPDFGNEDTTMLLKGLHIVCRFRSLFLEKRSEFNFLNFQITDAAQLVSQARRLGSELDAIVCDCVEAKLDQPASWADFVDAEKLHEMGVVWQPLNEKLIEECDAILSSSDEASIRAAGHRIAQVLQEVVRTTPQYNSMLLTAMAQKLVELSVTPTAGPPAALSAGQ